MWWTGGRATITDNRRHRHSFFILLAFISAILLTSGCSMFTRSGRTGEPSVFSQNPANYNTQDFQTAQKDLYRISQTHPNQNTRRKALYHLAKTLAHYNNPSPQYERALDYFKQYIKGNEEAPESEETRNWIAVLESFKEQSQKITVLIKQNSKLNKTKAENEKTIHQLKQEITKLKNNIKRLDTLYLKMERRRRKKN